MSYSCEAGQLKGTSLQLQRLNISFTSSDGPTVFQELDESETLLRFQNEVKTQ